MKATHKFVIGSLVLAARTFSLGAAGEKIDYEAIKPLPRKPLPGRQ